MLVAMRNAQVGIIRIVDRPLYHFSSPRVVVGYFARFVHVFGRLGHMKAQEPADAVYPARIQRTRRNDDPDWRLFLQGVVVEDIERLILNLHYEIVIGAMFVEM